MLPENLLFHPVFLEHIWTKAPTVINQKISLLEMNYGILLMQLAVSPGVDHSENPLCFVKVDNYKLIIPQSVKNVHKLQPL